MCKVILKPNNCICQRNILMLFNMTLILIVQYWAFTFFQYFSALFSILYTMKSWCLINEFQTRIPLRSGQSFRMERSIDLFMNSTKWEDCHGHSSQRFFPPRKGSLFSVVWQSSTSLQFTWSCGNNVPWRVPCWIWETFGLWSREPLMQKIGLKREDNLIFPSHLITSQELSYWCKINKLILEDIYSWVWVLLFHIVYVKSQPPPSVE